MPVGHLPTAAIRRTYRRRAGQNDAESGAAPTHEASEFSARSILVVKRGGEVFVDGVRVAIVWDEPMPGVVRPWWQCRCGRRCQYLVLRDKIGCAKCFGLQHFSNHYRRKIPQVGRIERLRRKLGDCELKPFAPLPTLKGRPHRAYYEKLVARILDEEAVLLGHLQTITRTLDRRIRVRKAKGKW